MPGCVLSAVGEEFDVNAFLVGSSLRPCFVYRRGELRRQAEVFPQSGMRLNISDADGELAEEISDAFRFLAAHKCELERLRNFSGVSDVRLDFGYYRRAVVAQFDYFPPELLALAGNLGIGIELSLYSCASESNDNGH